MATTGTPMARCVPLATFVIGIVLTVILYATRGWIWLAVPPIGEARVPFSDAAAQLVAGDACAQGAGDWHGDVCFLPSIDTPTHSQSYPPWIGFARAGLTADRYFAVAVALVLVFHLAMAALFRPRDAKQAVLLLALLFTPAIQLCVERANFDLLIAALIVAAAACASREGWAGYISACIALAIATVLKLYTGAALAFAFLAQRRLAVSRIAVSALATVVVVAWFGVANFRVLGRGAPEGQTSFSTGAHWLASHYGVFAVVTACALALTVGARAWLAFAPLVRSVSSDRFRANACVLSTATAVPLFLLKDSYDYRFVLWLPALALPVALLCGGNATAKARRYLCLQLACFFVASCTELAHRPLTLHAGAFAGKALLLDGILLAKQFAAWMLAASMVALTLRLVGAAVADGRARDDAGIGVQAHRGFRRSRKSDSSTRSRA